MRLRLFSFMAAALALAACAPLPYRRVEGALRAGDLAAARGALESARSDYGDKARLLYLFDQVSLAHYAGDWAASARAAEQANSLIDQLYTKSLSAEAASFLVNDMSLPYQGENFERVMLHLLAMLDYAALGSRDEALVEARRADQRLKAYAAKVGKDKVGYREDALARYVSAALYEGGSRQDLEDAYLDYRKADEAFELYAKLYGTPKPTRLKADLQRLAEGLGEKDDLERWRARDGAQTYPPLNETRGGKAELLVLLYAGLAPAKVSVANTVPLTLDDGTQQYFQLALPAFVVRDLRRPQATLEAPGQGRADFELFQDLNAIAVRDLQDRAGLILAKETARAIAKFQASRAIQKKARESGNATTEALTFLGTNLYTLFTEQADIRSWRTLPGRIYLARLALEPGEHRPRLLLEGGRALDLGPLQLKAGEKRFLVQTLF